MDQLLKVLAFFAGTSPAAIAHHIPQARTQVYTLGGFVVFVTVPYILCCTIFLASVYIAPELVPDWRIRWPLIALGALAATWAIVWTERTLIVMGDGVVQHWLPQLVLFAIRIGIIVLISFVVAQHWELASHQGLVRAERQVMRDEAAARHRQVAEQEFDVSGLTQRTQHAQTQIASLQQQLGSLPPGLQTAQSEVRSCKEEAQRLQRNYYNARQQLAGNSEASDAARQRVEHMRRSASDKAIACRTLERETEKQIKVYQDNVQAQLEQQKAIYGELSVSQRQAQREAQDAYTSRMAETSLALSEAGTDALAFARVREKYREIDRNIKVKTIFLALIELMPMVLKLLLWNSPITSEARAALLIYSEFYRYQMYQSQIAAQKAKAAVSASRTKRSGSP